MLTSTVSPRVEVYDERHHIDHGSQSRVCTAAGIEYRRTWDHRRRRFNLCRLDLISMWRPIRSGSFSLCALRVRPPLAGDGLSLGITRAALFLRPRRVPSTDFHRASPRSYSALYPLDAALRIGAPPDCLGLCYSSGQAPADAFKSTWTKSTEYLSQPRQPAAAHSPHPAAHYVTT